jgi:transposase
MICASSSASELTCGDGNFSTQMASAGPFQSPVSLEYSCGSRWGWSNSASALRIHAILDNYGTHKHPKVVEWLANHPRWVFHFTPTSASWLNAVEGFFSIIIITRRRIRRGVFTSVAELEEAIRRYIQEHNRQAKPFVWTKTANQIFDKLSHLPVPSE